MDWLVHLLPQPINPHVNSTSTTDWADQKQINKQKCNQHTPHRPMMVPGSWTPYPFPFPSSHHPCHSFPLSHKSIITDSTQIRKGNNFFFFFFAPVPRLIGWCTFLIGYVSHPSPVVFFSSVCLNSMEVGRQKKGGWPLATKKNVGLWWLRPEV